MDAVFDFFINLAIQYESVKAIYIILAIIGTLYVALILLRGFIYAIVKATKTEKDNAIVEKIYNFIDTYSLSFDKLKGYSKIEDTSKK